MRDESEITGAFRAGGGGDEAGAPIHKDDALLAARIVSHEHAITGPVPVDWYDPKAWPRKCKCKCGTEIQADNVDAMAFCFAIHQVYVALRLRRASGEAAGELREKLAKVMHESWSKTKRAQSFHGPNDACTNCDENERVRIANGIPADMAWTKCPMLHADLIPWEQLPEKQKDINRHAFDDALPIITAHYASQPVQQESAAQRKLFDLEMLREVHEALSGVRVRDDFQKERSGPDVLRDALTAVERLIAVVQDGELPEPEAQAEVRTRGKASAGLPTEELAPCGHPKKYTYQNPNCVSQDDTRCGMCDEENIQALEEIPEHDVPHSVTCKAGALGANDPQECNWPLCGCDPYADKVIEALHERGYGKLPASAGGQDAQAPISELYALVGKWRTDAESLLTLKPQDAELRLSDEVGAVTLRDCAAAVQDILRKALAARGENPLEAPTNEARLTSERRLAVEREMLLGTLRGILRLLDAHPNTTVQEPMDKSFVWQAREAARAALWQAEAPTKPASEGEK